MKNFDSNNYLTPKAHFRGMCVIFFLGIVIFFWKLGSTGLVDETPPLFAAAAREMGITGDYLTPRVNGLPRFDKPPLVYWFMSLFYSIPGNSTWDPLGSWSARLPSAISSLTIMIFLGDTVMKWPDKNELFPRRNGIITSLAFAISPLVLIWSRTAVSDALLCSTIGITLLLQWRQYVNPIPKYWIYSWIVLGLAVLTKGPIALVIVFLTNSLFSFYQKDFFLLFSRLNPIGGLCITALICTPWYLFELFVEGKPFWDSFFGYHNFQRFTSVVNSHNQPWWFFVMILIISSLPFTPLLILSIWQHCIDFFRSRNEFKYKRHQSLVAFSFCWLIAVLSFFTFSSTKLPSYWLPATPAAAILIASSANYLNVIQKNKNFAWICCVLINFIIAIVLFSLPLWAEYITDPQIPNLAEELTKSKLVFRSAVIFAGAAFLGIVFFFRPIKGKLLLMQFPIICFHLFALIPVFSLADNLRQKPIRNIAQMVIESKQQFEPLAMIGAKKPSLHFYTEKIVIYEDGTKQGLVNLSERMRLEERSGWEGNLIEDINGSDTALVVIDSSTIDGSKYWQGLNPEILGKSGVYTLWRLNRFYLEEREKDLRSKGVSPNWSEPSMERF